MEYEAGTFCYVQYFVYDGTQHVLDVAHYSTQSVISHTEGPSANHHRVHEADISGSWGENEQKTNKHQEQICKMDTVCCVNCHF